MSSVRSFAGIAILGYGLFIMSMLGMWGANIYKLTQCDFEPSYKAEVLYGIGVVSPTFIITAWMDIDD